jgi:hypothetical protein
MRYRRLKKSEGIRLFKDIIFLEIALDFLHNSLVEGWVIEYLPFHPTLLIGQLL